MIEFKSAYSDILKTCRRLGISYHEMLKMTLSEINDIGLAENQRHVDEINDRLLVAYQQAALTAIGTNNPKKFPQQSPKVQLKSSEFKPVNPKNIIDQMWGIAGMFGATRPDGV